MRFEFEVNKEKEKLEIYYEGELIASLDEDDLEDFSTSIKIAKRNFELATFEFDRVMMEDIEETLEDHEFSMDDIESIYLQVVKNTKLQKVETTMTLVTKNQIEAYLNVELSENFKEEEVWFGTASNHEIRNCFEQDVLDFLQSNKQIKLWFNDQKVELKELLEEEKTYWYDFGEVHVS